MAMPRQALGATITMAIAITLSGGAAQAQNSAVTAATAEIDISLRAAVERRDIPGVVALITTGERVLYQGAFGVADAETGRPMTADAMFRIASMTKAIASTALMQLVEQNALQLDDPAEKYLPQLAKLSVFESFDGASGAYRVRSAARSVTVRQLLTHTSGLGYNFTSPIVRDFKPRSGEMYAAGPLLFEPGARWHYGTSTDWVGRLVERISHKPLEEYFREKIFLPLQMSDTSYNVPQDRLARLVAVHRRGADGAVVKEPTQPPTVIAQPIGGGGLSSTASDYGRFVRMLLKGGELDGARMLKAETVALMGENHIGELGVPALKTAMPERSADFTFVADGRDKWGLGFLITTDQVDGKRSAGSLSWGGINNTYFWIDRKRGIAGVILMQFLPFADPRALAVYDVFERAAYKLVAAAEL
jgi:methyl acetate hydrolase